MTFEDNLNESIADFLRARGVDVVSIFSWEDDYESDGYCETCYYTWAVVRIKYVDSTDAILEYTYSGDFGELIRELT